jgi:hypothetical protein
MQWHAEIDESEQTHDEKERFAHRGAPQTEFSATLSHTMMNCQPDLYFFSLDFHQVKVMLLILWVFDEGVLRQRCKLSRSLFRQVRVVVRKKTHR